MRPHIKINGNLTIEVDYKAMHPAMLFANQGLPIPDDAYALVPGVSDNAELRLVAKKTFNALLNAGPKGTDELKAFDNETYGISAEDFRQRVADAYPMLPGILFSGIGLRLQRAESDLAERIMLHFVAKGVTILPIHDSFIVEAKHGAELANVMQETFRNAYGQHPRITSKPSLLE